MKKKLRNIYTQFPEGKHKVLTLSFDDGKIADKRLLDIFNEYGIKGTFNLNSGMEKNPFKNDYDERISLSEIKDLYKGHEVACHTYRHPSIARCPKEQIIAQIMEDRRILEEYMGTTVRGMAYPNGSVNSDVVDAMKACGMAYGRTVVSTHNYEMPEDLFRWNPTCKHNDKELEDIYNTFIKHKKTQYLIMLYVWGHSYEFERDDNWNIIEKFSKKIGNKSDIWYATNIEIVDYMEAAGRVKVSVNGDFAYNPSAMSVWLEVDKKSIELKGGMTTEL